jgi:WD40 repeat protein
MLIGAISGRSAAAPLSLSLLASTLRAGVKTALGGSRASAELPAQALGLVNGVLRSLWLTKLKVMALVLVAVMATGGIATWLWRAATDPGKEQPVPVAQLSGHANAHRESRARIPRTDLFGDPLPPGAISRLGSVRWRLQGNLADAMVATEDGKELVTADRENGLACWDMDRGSARRQIPADPAVRKACLPAQAIALSANGRKVALGGDRSMALGDGQSSIHILDTQTGAELQVFRSRDVDVRQIALSADGRLVAARSRFGSVLLWDVRLGREPRRIGPEERRPTQAPILYDFQKPELAFSPDGRLFAWVGNEVECPVHIYDTAKGAELHCLGKYKGTNRFITFSPDGSKLASLSDEGPGGIWDTATGKELLRLPHSGRSVAGLPPPVATFSSEGKSLALKAPGEPSTSWNSRPESSAGE